MHYPSLLACDLRAIGTTNSHPPEMGLGSAGTVYFPVGFSFVEVNTASCSCSLHSCQLSGTDSETLILDLEEVVETFLERALAELHVSAHLPETPQQSCVHSAPMYVDFLLVPW